MKRDKIHNEIKCQEPSIIPFIIKSFFLIIDGILIYKGSNSSIEDQHRIEELAQEKDNALENRAVLVGI